MHLYRITLLLILLSIVKGFPVRDHGLGNKACPRSFPERGPCPAVSKDEDCPHILFEGTIFRQEFVRFSGLPCAECLEATVKNLTLTPDTDPLWYPNPDLPVTGNKSNPFSLPCRWALRYYLHAVAPEPLFKCTMLGMCTTIFEFGTTAIRCLEKEYPLIAYRVFGQLVRCNFARDMLGEEWGAEIAEKTVFTDIRTDRSVGVIEFIQEGFPPLASERSSTKVGRRDSKLTREGRYLKETVDYGECCATASGS